MAWEKAKGEKLQVAACGLYHANKQNAINRYCKSTKGSVGKCCVEAKEGGV